MPTLSQNLVKTQGVFRPLEWNIYKTEHELAASLDRELHRVPSPVLGLSISLSREGTLEALALATPRRAFVLYFRGHAAKRSSKEMSERVGTDAFAALLGGQKKPILGFDMARLAMHVRHGISAHVCGTDLSSMSPKSSPGEFIKSLLDHTADQFAIDTLWDAFPAELHNDPRRLEFLCLRAWLSARVAAHPKVVDDARSRTTLDTARLPSKYFKPIVQMLIDLERVEAASPRVIRNDFGSVSRDQAGNIIIGNERFQNRIRASERTRVALVEDNGKIHLGIATSAEGKRTLVTLDPIRAGQASSGPHSVREIQVLGKEGFSYSERARESFLLSLLQGKCSLDDPACELVKLLYFSGKDLTPRRKFKRSIIRSFSFGKGRMKMNQSQTEVVEAMVKSDMDFVVVHGPPGTGKTTTISFATQEWIKQKSSVWIVAQSNVGVKNIAERLCRDGINFRLLVSKDFYAEWHEHIYEPKVQELLIRTDQLPADIKSVAYKLLGVKVMLCTLAMLSNPALESKRVFDFVPLTNLVVDEASQVAILSYMHILANFKRLNKVCFFGDPKQSPPYGQDQAPMLKSVFELEHLKNQTYFLDTQYRMPVPLGSFISTEVYDSKLQSSHAIKSYSCVTFVDVNSGQEQQRGLSWVNYLEIQTIVDLARHYYEKKNYCVLTPYDAQRNEIEKALKSEGLRWDNVYNVDSFQGEEADFILLSVVRTSGPGFLTSLSRANVMLTRCRTGMVIVTKRPFMKLKTVEETLLGRLCSHWERVCGHDGAWTDWRDVAEVISDLPGAPGGTRTNPHASVPYHQPVQKAIAVARDASNSSHRLNASILSPPMKPLPRRPRRHSESQMRSAPKPPNNAITPQQYTKPSRPSFSTGRDNAPRFHYATPIQATNSNIYPRPRNEYTYYG